MKKCVTVLLIAMVSMVSLCASAQDKIADVTDMQSLRAAIKSDKKTFVAATLQLTPAEAKKFWPKYAHGFRVTSASTTPRCNSSAPACPTPATTCRNLFVRARAERLYCRRSNTDPNVILREAKDPSLFVREDLNSDNEVKNGPALLGQ